MNDICLHCGREHEYALWGAKCNCTAPEVVHQQECSGCEAVIGVIIDDDYCAAERLYCLQCVKTAKEKKNAG